MPSMAGNAWHLMNFMTPGGQQMTAKAPPEPLPLQHIPYSPDVSPTPDYNIDQIPYAPGWDPAFASQFTANYTPPPVGNGAGGGGKGAGGAGLGSVGGIGSNKELADILAELRKKGDAMAQAQRNAAGPMRDHLKNLLGQEVQYDLTPLAALVDQWTGSRFAQSYKAPESARERQERVLGAQRGVTGAEAQASAAELAALKDYASGRMDLRKMDVDEWAKREDLGIKREGLGIEREKLAIDRMKAAKAGELPIDLKSEVTGLATKNANKVSISNQMKGYLQQFKNAETEDQKVVIGRQMLKVLNSPEGADAIGAEEAKRLGGLLETAYLPRMPGEPGPTFGRDLDLFEQQVEDTINAVDTGVSLNQQRINQIMGRQGAASGGSAPAVPKIGDVVDGYRFRGGSPGSPSSWEKL